MSPPVTFPVASLDPPENVLQQVRDLLASVERGEVAAVAFAAVERGGDISKGYAYEEGAALHDLLAGVTLLQSMVLNLYEEP